jgi:hypothetical protein
MAEGTTMDQNERIERLKEAARRLSGGPMQSFGLDDLPPDTAEQFLEDMIAVETAEATTTDFELLTADGVPLPAPDEVSDEAIAVVLWRVIFGLAHRRVFLSQTNHLSDRELYAVLWHTVLREEVERMPDSHRWASHVVTPGDDPESTNYLAYYATEQERAWSQEKFPDVALPPRRQPLYDRDDDLPRAEDDPPIAEAKQWLQASRNTSALATNRFGTTANALRFVEELYERGASCVFIDRVVNLPHDGGQSYADELFVVLPGDGRRKALLDLIEEEGRPDTLDDEEHFVDHGRGSVSLWWD